MTRICPPFLKRLPTILAIVCFFFSSGIVRPADGDFRFTVLEIPDIERGAGLAVMMQTPSGKVWFYDTGSGYPMKLSSDGWQGNFNAGRDLIAPLLKKQSITAIDGIFISHAHYDHFGGLLWLKCHILVAPGHGIHPIPPAFGEAARPEVSIASVFERYARGIRSTAGLQALGAKTYITGLHGSVQVVTDGKTYQVTTEREDTPKTDPAKAAPKPEA